MLQHIQAIIFDLDGTLVDSMWVWEEIDIDYLNKYQMELPEELQHEIEGLSFTETAIFFKERFNISDSIEQIKEDWNKLAIEKYANHIFLKNGAKDLLEYAKKKKIKLGIASSNSRELIEALLNGQNISTYFDTVVTSCEAKKGKPAPDVYLLAAKNLGVDPSKCLVFEDVPAGIKAGLSAGMKVCGVDDLFSLSKRSEKIELADFYITDFTDVKYPL